MAISKIIYKSSAEAEGEVWMDVTGDNPATDNMLVGTRATGANGETVQGAVVTASASTSNPEMDGTAAPGTASTYSRGDHVHPTDTSRAPTSHASSATTYGTGTSSNYGHLKLSDSTTSTSGTSGGIAATPAAVKAVKDAIPTTTSGLTNDSGFITEDDLILPEIIGNADSGTTVTAIYGSKTITGTATGGTFDLKIPSYGTWTVSGTVDGATASATVEVDSVKEYNVVLYPELEDASWAMISTAAQEGIAGSIWSVGDTKSVALSGTVGTLSLNTTLYVYIIGINHRGTNGVTFQGFKTAQADGKNVCLVDSHYGSNSSDGSKWFNMNHWGDSAASPYNTSYGGWKGCDFRYDILGSTDTAPSGYGAMFTTNNVGYDASSTTATNPVANTLMAALPASLRALMKPMTIYTDNVGNETDTEAAVTTSIDYLPLLAEFEIFGARSYANQYEQNYQSQYDYYAAGNKKVKYMHSATGSTAIWWARSPDYSGAIAFCSVYTAGVQYNSLSRGSRGVAPAFMV